MQKEVLLPDFYDKTLTCKALKVGRHERLVFPTLITSPS